MKGQSEGRIGRDGDVMADLLQQLPKRRRCRLDVSGRRAVPNCASAFERRMTADPVLAAKIDAMRAMEDQVFARIAHLDETAVSTINTAASARQASRVIRQWVVDQARRPAGDAEPQHIFRFPRWSYPLAAAAAIVVAFLVWSDQSTYRRTARREHRGLRQRIQQSDFAR